MSYSKLTKQELLKKIEWFDHELSRTVQYSTKLEGEIEKLKSEIRKVSDHNNHLLSLASQNSRVIESNVQLIGMLHEHSRQIKDGKRYSPPTIQEEEEKERENLMKMMLNDFK